MGIMFHIAYWYLPNSQKLLTINEFSYSKTCYWITEIIHLFRMDSFFLIAGFFAAMGLSKLNFRDFLLSRMHRLHILNIVPVIFLITTLIVYLLGISRGNLNPLSGDYWHALIFMHHLWFLFLLFIQYYIYGYLLKNSKFIDILVNKIKPAHVLLLGLVFIVWAILAKLFPILWSRNSGVEVFYRLFIYLPYFMLGAVMYHNRKVAESFMQLNWIRLLFCFAIISIYLYFINMKFGLTTGDVESFYAVKLTIYVLHGFAALCAIYLIFVGSVGLFKKDSKVLKYLANRSYTVYLLHFPFCLVVGYFFTKVNFNPILEYTVSVFLIYGVTLLMHDVLMKLINLKPAKLKVMEPN